MIPCRDCQNLKLLNGTYPICQRTITEKYTGITRALMTSAESERTYGECGPEARFFELRQRWSFRAWLGRGTNSNKAQDRETDFIFSLLPKKLSKAREKDGD